MHQAYKDIWSTLATTKHSFSSALNSNLSVILDIYKPFYHILTNQTRWFLYVSSTGVKYIMIIHDANSNIKLSHALHTRVKTGMLKAYTFF